MSVKRYEWDRKSDCDCEIVEQPDGAMVDYDEHASVVAALEARCAALAAENGQMLRLLTDISENHDEYVNQDEYLYAGVPMDYVSEINAYVSRDVEAGNPFKETDAFLAEVRASAIEYAASERWGSGYVFYELNELAAQLRKGVQS